MTNEPGLTSLLTVREAIRILDAVPVQPRMVRVPLGQADGLRLAEPLRADRDYPPFDKSQMDGYAVRRADVSAEPAELRLVGEVAAGQWPDRAVGPGEAVAVMTGAPMPVGAEGVVPVEDAEKVGPSAVRLRSEGDPGRYVLAKGADCPAGQLVLSPGTRMGPAQLAVAATIGAAEIDVFAAPRVAVLATGDEVVPVDREPGPSQIRNSNSPMLVSLLRRMGCVVTDLGIAPDQPEAIRDAILRGLEHDVLFVAGGMSMGEHDYVPSLLRELGLDLPITKLRIKPGKPFVFGVRGSGNEPTPASRFVFGLPGNPVSAFVCTLRLASRLLARLAGGPVEERWLAGKLDVGLPANGPREFYQPAVRTVSPGRDSSHCELASIAPLKWKGSADLFTLARANCLLVRPENDPAMPKGTAVRVLEI